MITAQDILDLLPIVSDRGWRVCLSGHIRDRDGRCPVCSAVHEISGGEVDHHVCATYAARVAFGYEPVSAIEVYRVTNAADLSADNLRPALMAALGMTKGATA